jgi:hypothetical protein
MYSVYLGLGYVFQFKYMTNTINQYYQSSISPILINYSAYKTTIHSFQHFNKLTNTHSLVTTIVFYVCI